MTTAFLAPDPIQSTQFVPGGNTPASGGQLFFYVAGSSTKQTAYKDSAALTAWVNPIVLDSGGNLPSGGEVWFPSGQTFKVVFAPSTDTDPPVSPYWTKDNLPGMNDVSSGGTTTPGEWLTGPTPTFISATSFSLVGDQTATLTIGRRVKTTNTAGIIYSTVLASAFSSVTTVTVSNDTGSLDSGLSALFYGLISADFPSIPYRLDCLIPLTSVGTTSNVQIKSVFTSTYPKYIMEIYSWTPATDGSDAWLRFSGDNASTFLATSNAYAHQRIGISNSTSFATGSASDTKIQIASLMSTNQTLPFSLKLEFNRPLDVTRYKTIKWYGSYVSNVPTYVDVEGSGFFTFATSSYNAIQLLHSSTNVSSMAYAVFGERA